MAPDPGSAGFYDRLQVATFAEGLHLREMARRLAEMQAEDYKSCLDKINGQRGIHDDEAKVMACCELLRVAPDWLIHGHGNMYPLGVYPKVGTPCQALRHDNKWVQGELIAVDGVGLELKETSRNGKAINHYLAFESIRQWEVYQPTKEQGIRKERSHTSLKLVVLAEELDETVLDLIEREVKAVDRSNTTVFTMDMDAILYANSVALGRLVHLALLLQDQGIHFEVCEMSPFLQATVMRSRLNRVLNAGTTRIDRQAVRRPPEGHEAPDSEN